MSTFHKLIVRSKFIPSLAFFIICRMCGDPDADPSIVMRTPVHCTACRSTFPVDVMSLPALVQHFRIAETMSQ
ncbi:hypothetical protein CPB84DRAFT_1765367 [Gymnopilus junonius]|uniref:Uncharacterized protein n=1 Tax=Gymnopilus junonius TaxID=109634 RepID=A0A9P5NYJ7_GYMJU|nr:hypothetical protein CPB84DRAFT_1765367 [Gymnopilus junonius]